MRVVVLTSDKHSWLLKGYMYQWSKYNNGLDKVTVAGFTEPGFKMEQGFTFYSIGEFSDYPANKWSNAIIKLLEYIPDELLFIMLEDYWLARNINVSVVKDCYNYMKDNNDVARMDLTNDRLNGGMPKDICHENVTDIIESNKSASYNSSMQASMWNRDALLSIMVQDESPWEFELNGNSRLENSPYRVCGTRQNPVSYQIMVTNGLFNEGNPSTYPYRRLSEKDLQELKDKGYTDERTCNRIK